MGVVVKERNLKTFDTKLALKSKSTQRGYGDAFTNFERFCQAEFQTSMDSVIADLKIVEEESLFDTLQSWINYNVEGKRSRNTIRTWFSAINVYLHYRGIKIDNRDVKENLTFPAHIQHELYGLTVDDIKKILDVARIDKKVMLLCQLSSGMRSGELLQIRKSDLDLSTRRIMVKIRPSIAKGNKARTTFFSKEAGNMLRNIIRNKDDDDIIFGNDKKEVRNVRQYNEQILIGYCKKVGLAKKYENSVRFTISSHSFRAFFITKVSRHDENVAKKLAGQTGYLLQYDRMNDEEKLDEYIKFENDLTIYSDHKIKTELDEMKKENSTLMARLDSIEAKIKERDESLERSSKQFQEDIANGKQDEIRKRWAEEESRSVPMD